MLICSIEKIILPKILFIINVVNEDKESKNIDNHVIIF
jgi:hypothetical protein